MHSAFSLCLSELFALAYFLLSIISPLGHISHTPTTSFSFRWATSTSRRRLLHLLKCFDRIHVKILLHLLEIKTLSLTRSFKHLFLSAHWLYNRWLSYSKQVIVRTRQIIKVRFGKEIETKVQFFDLQKIRRKIETKVQLFDLQKIRKRIETKVQLFDLQNDKLKTWCNVSVCVCIFQFYSWGFACSLNAVNNFERVSYRLSNDEIWRHSKTTTATALIMTMMWNDNAMQWWNAIMRCSDKMQWWDAVMKCSDEKSFEKCGNLDDILMYKVQNVWDWYHKRDYIRLQYREFNR